MRIENQVNNVSPFKTSHVQNKNVEKVATETKNVQQKKPVQKMTIENNKNVKSSDVKNVRQDVVNPEVKALGVEKVNNNFKVYTKDGSATKLQVQQSEKLDVRV